MQKITLSPPVENFNFKNNISQMFGVDRETYYEKFGLPGHQGLDIVVRTEKNGYGERVLAAHNGTVEKITYDVPHQSRGNGIYLLSEDGTFSTIYWHLSGFDCRIGQKINTGDTIGRLGNSGFTVPRPTPSNPWGGAHVHFAVLDNTIANNEYGGIVDPTPFLFKEGNKLPIKFNRGLFCGVSYGDDISWLQTCMKLEGYAQDYEPIGIYGYKTMRDVKLFQEKNGLTPVLGFTGPKTRALLNEKYAI